ncbi:MAG: hypothetical protein FJ272_11230, partial [Planctomycetes bacterium]|nr:hypothetical protein [Planctomycetota bacterium]
MEWPFRVKVPLPAEPGAFVQCPLKVAADLTALGVNGMVNHDSIQVVEEGSNDPLPRRVADGLVEWQSPKAARGFLLYFDTHRYSVEAPLVARRKVVPVRDAPAPPPAPDYATLAYGKPWDFDDGTFSGIDQWGDKPEFLRNKKVQDGILSMDVSQDPFFIWGDMWGQVRKVGQKVAIDLDKFPVLEMKVRQSVSHAMWEIYGRPGTSDRLLHHEFPVSGSGWQRLRMDLKKDARWRGVLSAFRIDPTKLVDAHVEIDWVRLTAVTPVEHGRVETVGGRRAVPARIGLETDCGVGQLRNSIEASKTALRAGSTQDVRVSLTDASGKGVARHPVRVELASGSGGELADSEKQKSLALSPQSRRGLTDEAGRLAVRHIVSRKAAKDADTLIARVEFADVPEAKTTVSTVAGPPHHYRVEPRKVVALKASDLPLALSAQLVDEFDNPVGETRRVTWETDEGAKVLDAAMTLSASGLAKATWKGDDKARWVFSVRVKD